MRILMLVIATMIVLSALQAQVGVRLDFNVSSQPVWGPTGYDHVEYYYLPDIEAYYYVPRHVFYYQEGGRWVSTSRLPSRYHDFDFYNSYKVVVNDPKPYRNHARYRDEYSGFKGRHDQEVIRDSRDERYYVIKDHPEHNNWMKQQKHDNGNGRGKGNKHNKGNGQGKHGEDNN